MSLGGHNRVVAIHEHRYLCVLNLTSIVVISIADVRTLISSPVVVILFHTMSARETKRKNPKSMDTSRNQTFIYSYSVIL